MKHSARFLLAVGFMAAALLGGLMATMLAPTPVEAAPQAAVFGPQIKVTGFNLPFDIYKSVDASNYKLVDAGNFVVESSSSIVEVSFQGSFDLFSTLDPGECVFIYIRIDDSWVFKNHMADICVPLETTGSVHLNFSGFWQEELVAGEHTVSIWVEYNGSLPIQLLLGAHGASFVIVKEYLPFGTTYMPSIHQ